MKESGQLHAPLALHFRKVNFVLVEPKSEGTRAGLDALKKEIKSHSPAGNRTMILGFSTRA
jgi:hypothetical protein